MGSAADPSLSSLRIAFEAEAERLRATAAQSESRPHRNGRARAPPLAKQGWNRLQARR
jgi:hypothetical protein